MNHIRFVALLGILTTALLGTGCVADGTYYGGGGGYYGGGGPYGPGYYGAPGPVVVEGGPVYRETVVVENNRYRGRDDRYYRGDRRGPYYSGNRRGGVNGHTRRGGPAVVERRGAVRRTPAAVSHRAPDKKRHDDSH